MELVALLVAGALALKFWFVIVAVVGTVAAVYYSRRAVDRHVARIGAERRRLAGLRGRAEAQHNWTLQGDDRGLYGEYPPAAI
jgi:hypothetical protein